LVLNIENIVKKIQSRDKEITKVGLKYGEESTNKN